jgi:hypothetical protein
MAAAAAKHAPPPSSAQNKKTHWWPSTILTDTKHHGRGLGKRAEACSARNAAARPVRNTRVLCVVAVGARAFFVWSAALRAVNSVKFARVVRLVLC